jgi:hypothetical protein
MLAWRGGRRRLVREQKARRKLEGVFNAAAKISKPVSRFKKPATMEDLGEQFSALRTKPIPGETNVLKEELRNNEHASAAAEAAQASPQHFRALPAFPSLGNTITARTGISLDILAIQGGPHHLKTDFKKPTEEAEISSGKNLALEEKKNSFLHPPLVKKNQASPASSSKNKKVSGDIDAQNKQGYQLHTTSAMMNHRNDVELMSLEL